MELEQTGAIAQRTTYRPNGHDATDHATDIEKTAAEQFFEAQTRARELREGAIKELIATRDKFVASIEQIDQQLTLAGYVDPIPATATEGIERTVEVPTTATPNKRRGRPAKVQAAPVGEVTKKRVMSAETRAKMAASQKKRHAAARKAAQKG
jgi:hypothetical protein